MDAKSLYDQGVEAVRARQLDEGRRLLTEALRLDPANDMAWLWLARTLTDTHKQRQCVERALRLNPNNEPAQTLYRRLSANGNDAAAGSPPAGASRLRRETEIADLLVQAGTLSASGNDEGALALWVRVLQHQPDHEAALKAATRTLARLGYGDDADELVERALQAGTHQPFVYLMAMDNALLAGDEARFDHLRDAMARLPDADEETVVAVVRDYIDTLQTERARDLLQVALEHFPDNQKLLLYMGDLASQAGRGRETISFYNRAARVNPGSKEGREADKKLSLFPPILTDRERGSLTLAWREALGVGLFFLLLAWQDAGLDLLALGVNRLLGIVVGLLGGYLLVTATSSPQQRPLTRLLGGTPPVDLDVGGAGVLQEPSQIPALPMIVRVLFGTAGAMLLLFAFVLVFGDALQLLTNPVTPTYPYLDDPGF